MRFVAEITGIAKVQYGSPGYTVTAEGRWEGFEADKNTTLTLTIPPQALKSFEVGAGIEVALLRS